MPIASLFVLSDFSTLVLGGRYIGKVGGCEFIICRPRTQTRSLVRALFLHFPQFMRRGEFIAMIFSTWHCPYWSTYSRPGQGHRNTRRPPGPDTFPERKPAAESQNPTAHFEIHTSWLLCSGRCVFF